MTTKAIRTISPDERRARESQVVCRAIFALQDDLQLAVKEMEAILGVDRKTLGRWKANGAIPDLTGHLRQAASHLVAVYRSLLAIFVHPSDRQQWMRAVHPELNAEPADLLQNLEGLIRVRRYLDFVRGRGA